MANAVKLIVLALLTLFFAVAASYGRDLAYQVHALIFMAVAAWMFVLTLQRTGEPVRAAAVSPTGYMDGVIRYGVIATVFWGVVGFLVGVVIASQLAFDELNFGLSFTSFGRLRPLHTSAVIFAAP